LVTASDDGYVLFWNIPNDLVTEAKAHRAQALAGESKSSGGNRLTLGKKNIKVGAAHLSASFLRKIPEFKPKYELYLAGYAQLQNLILCNEYLIALDNDSNVSILKCKI
jgi:hypothetical protein